MILGHVAPSSFDMSPYRAKWIHFGPTFMILPRLIQDFPGTKIWDPGNLEICNSTKTQNNDN